MGLGKWRRGDADITKMKTRGMNEVQTTSEFGIHTTIFFLWLLWLQLWFVFVVVVVVVVIIIILAVVTIQMSFHVILQFYPTSCIWALRTFIWFFS